MCNCGKGKLGGLGALNTPNFASMLQDKTSLEVGGPNVVFESDEVNGNTLVYVLLGGVAAVGLGLIIWKATQ
jgi:hypothetical protein